MSKSTFTEIALTTVVPTIFTVADCETLALACAQDYPAYASEWDEKVLPVNAYADRSQVPDTAFELLMSGDPPPEDKGVEAFHEDPNGRPDGICFAGWLLNQPGGAKWDGPLAVSEAASHEWKEAIGNPRTNLLLQGPIVGPDGKTYFAVWRERCDPAQGERSIYVVNGVSVAIAGHITQSWEDPKGQPPYSYPAGVVKAPLTAGPEGYLGLVDGQGNVSTVFAEKCHPAIRELKEKHGRLAAMFRAQSAILAAIRAGANP